MGGSEERGRPLPRSEREREENEGDAGAWVVGGGGWEDSWGGGWVNAGEDDGENAYGWLGGMFIGL